jgi:hypothetical protein
MKIPVYLFNKPSNLSMVASALSFAAWAFPNFGVLRKGFDRAAALDPVAILVLASWWALIFVCFRIGEFFGTPAVTRASRPRLSISLDADLPYYTFTIIAAVGVLAASAKILGSLSLEGAVSLVTSGQANELKEAILDDYQVGLLSLRYVAVYPAVIAMYRLVTRRRMSFSIVLNLLLLLLVTLITGRLSLVAAITTTFLVLNYNVQYRKVRVSRMLLVVASLFSILSVFNYTRNLGFYEERGLGFWSSGFAEIITYLGSSSQVALGTAARTSDLVLDKPEHYRELVDVEIQANAVSAFVMLHESMGYLCWLYIALVCTVSGFVFSRLVAMGATLYLLPCGSILYASAELWRLNLFGQGIFIVLMIVGIGVPLFCSLVALPGTPERLAA